MPLQLRFLVLTWIQQALQEVDHQACMVGQLLIAWKVVDVHNEEICAFAACPRQNSVSVQTKLSAYKAHRSCLQAQCCCMYMPTVTACTPV